MENRDFDTNPYSNDEKRVAEWFFEKGIGGGDDPIGSMIASHEHLAAQRNLMKIAIREYLQWSDHEICTDFELRAIRAKLREAIE